jgi:hypothetical protein
MTANTNIKETIGHAVSMAAHYQREIDNLLARYGDGVRPSWVSADIGMAQHRRDTYLRMIERLEADG